MKNRAFTLVEILAVITIIGILALITIPTVDSIIKASREDAYEDQKAVIMAGLKDYAAANTFDMPSTDGETYEVTIGTLKLGGFLDVNLINPINDMCFSNDTILVITRDRNAYTYTFKDEDNIEFTETCEVN